MATPEASLTTRRAFHRVLVAGSLGMLPQYGARCFAQDEDEPVEFSSELTVQYGRAARVMRDIQAFLEAIEFHRPATIGTNYFGVSVGGVDAVKDLEEGRGVDPETLAGLYAGFALPSIAKHLNAQTSSSGGIKIQSQDGRLRYKGTVVRMYSPNHLRTLFERRDGFRNDSDRVRRQFFAEFVYGRKREQGQFERVGQENEISELLGRFQRMQSALTELATGLEAERPVTSILQGETAQHFFAISIGGINVTEDLQSGGAVDPETLAAIYAQKISTDYAGAFQVGNDGAILYDGVPIKLYSQERLEWCFKTRERLEELSIVR